MKGVVQQIITNQQSVQMLDLNPCSPISDSLPDGTQVRLLRIVMLVGLLLLYLLHHTVALVQLRRVGEMKKEAEYDCKVALANAEFNKWRKQSVLMFGDHCVALGFVLSFSPYQFESLLIYSHLLLRGLYEIRLHCWNNQTKALKTGARVINMGLLLCAMVGVSRSTATGPNCDDSSFLCI